MKPKYYEEAKLRYMDTDSLTIYIKTDDTYKDIAEMLKQRLLLQTRMQLHFSIQIRMQFHW